MRIGELARLTGTSNRALRYYEQQGLINSVRRDNGYRDYDEVAVTRVGNVRMLLRIGMSTEEIAGFGACLDKDLKTEPTCAAAMAQFEARMSAMEGRIVQLVEVHQRLREHVDGLRTEAETGSSPR